MGGVTRRRAVVAALIVTVLVAGFALFGRGDSPGRALVFHLRNMECWKMPESGGVAALGDSITAGTQDPELGLLGKQSWFAQAVCHDGVPYAYNAAIPNYTTEEVWTRLDTALKHHPDAVVILTGTNDVLNHRSLSHAVALIDRMTVRVRRSGAVPVLATVPPFNAAPRRADRFNRLLRRAARAEHTAVIDFHRVLASRDRYREPLTGDGLHPSVAGAKAMAAVAAPVLRAAVARTN